MHLVGFIISSKKESLVLLTWLTQVLKKMSLHSNEFIMTGPIIFFTSFFFDKVRLHYLYMSYELSTECASLEYKFFKRKWLHFKPKLTGDGVHACLFWQISTKDWYSSTLLQSNHRTPVVIMLATGTRVRGFKPSRSRWIFRASEKSSACLPSEGKWKNLSHVPA